MRLTRQASILHTTTAIPTRAPAQAYMCVRTIASCGARPPRWWRGRLLAARPQRPRRPCACCLWEKLRVRGEEDGTGARSITWSMGPLCVRWGFCTPTHTHSATATDLRSGHCGCAAGRRRAPSWPARSSSSSYFLLRVVKSQAEKSLRVLWERVMRVSVSAPFTLLLLASIIHRQAVEVERGEAAVVLVCVGYWLA